jgi:hypothetical protein
MQVAIRQGRPTSKEHCTAVIAQLQQLNNVVHTACIVGSKAVLNVLGLPNGCPFRAAALASCGWNNAVLINAEKPLIDWVLNEVGWQDEHFAF